MEFRVCAKTSQRKTSDGPEARPEARQNLGHQCKIVATCGEGRTIDRSRGSATDDRKRIAVSLNTWDFSNAFEDPSLISPASTAACHHQTQRVFHLPTSTTAVVRILEVPRCCGHSSSATTSPTRCQLVSFRVLPIILKRSACVCSDGGHQPGCRWLQCLKSKGPSTRSIGPICDRAGSETNPSAIPIAGATVTLTIPSANSPATRALNPSSLVMLTNDSLGG